MLDPAVLNRLIDLATVIAIVGVAILALALVEWKIRQTRAWHNRDHRRTQRRINQAANDWPTNVQPIRPPVNHEFDKAA